MSPRMAFSLEVIREAGAITHGHFTRPVNVHYKSDESPVTIADQEAEEHLRRRIAEVYPGEAILGEEQGLTGSGRARWVIDPIDGTKSFICQVPLYAVLLSFEVDEVPEVACAYFPETDELLYAERGSGAFHNGHPCKVSQKESLEHAVICVGGHRSAVHTGRMAGIIALSEKCLATRTWCDAYGHMLVATGRVEAMVDPVLQPYDISAMSLIVEEAGGRCTDFNGGPWPRTAAISSNLALHSTVLEAFKSES